MFLDFLVKSQTILIIENKHRPYSDVVLNELSLLEHKLIVVDSTDNMLEHFLKHKPIIVIAKALCPEELTALQGILHLHHGEKQLTHLILLVEESEGHLNKIERDRPFTLHGETPSHIYYVHMPLEQSETLVHTVRTIISNALLSAYQSFSNELAHLSTDAIFILNDDNQVCFKNDFAAKLPIAITEALFRSQHIDVKNQAPDSQTHILGSFSISVKSITAMHQHFRIVSLSDQSEKHDLKSQIHTIAFYDTLTKLPNRVLVKERLHNEIARIHRSKAQLGVFYIDLDGFKYINETLGHSAGDELLTEVGRRLVTTLREEDFVAHLSADEFLVLASGLQKSEYVGKIADNILKAIGEPYIVCGRTIVLTASIGIALAPDDGDTETQLLTNAEIAMFRAKENGRGKFESFTQELSNLAQQRMILEHDLRKAIQNSEFVSYYQPKVLASTEKIVGMEALIRWKHPEHGLIPPNVFIPLAEETGLIIPIGESILKQACLDNQQLQDDGYEPLVVSVNLSMRQFEKPQLIDTIQQILRDTRLSPKWLELEITESIAMLNVDTTLQTIRSLQGLGIQISIDDFGTGYSSLSKLGTLAVDKLKIDRSFISNMSSQNQDTAIASTILTLGKHLNLQIIAEGVETPEQVDFLREHFCDELQGYYFGKPMTIDAFRLLLGGERHV